MQLTSTLFVLGAGSSAEFGLPTGSGLANHIAKHVHFGFEDGLTMTSGDRVIWDQIKRHSREDIESYFSAGQVIWRGVPFSRSIDDFLYNHGDNAHAVKLGKVAISRAILQAESNSRLISLVNNDQNHDHNIQALSDTWLFKLFRFLQTDVRRQEVYSIFDGVEFINFNYDRCLELFLFNAIQAAYSLNESVAAKVTNTLKVLRPYGSVGRLQWQNGTADVVPFGANGQHVDLFKLSSGISTLTEQSFGAELEAIRIAVGRAKRIIFLGFGFHKQNMRLMSLDRAPIGLRVYATVKDASAADQRVFKDMISTSLCGGAVPDAEFIGCSCANFIDHFGLRLAFPS